MKIQMKPCPGCGAMLTKTDADRVAQMLQTCPKEFEKHRLNSGTFAIDIDMPGGGQMSSGIIGPGAGPFDIPIMGVMVNRPMAATFFEELVHQMMNKKTIIF